MGIAVGFICPECEYDVEHEFLGWIPDEDGYDQDAVLQCHACGHVYTERLFLGGPELDDE